VAGEVIEPTSRGILGEDVGYLRDEVRSEHLGVTIE
jgi:hypothetical protein